jgi:hypothetical protein
MISIYSRRAGGHFKLPDNDVLDPVNFTAEVDIVFAMSYASAEVEREITSFRKDMKLLTEQLECPTASKAQQH